MKNKIKVFNCIAIVLIFTLSATSCSGQSGGGKSLNSAEELKKYLDSQPANGPDKPIKVSMGANAPMLPKIAEAINASGKYVSLNLTGNVLTTIPEEAFKKCETLVSITIPNGVTIIESGAFAGCTGLSSVNIPASVTSIGYKAFTVCTGLTSVNIPASVTSIGGWAFSDCTSLTSVTIPDSVTTIEDQAFRVCTSLTSVTFEGTISSDNLGGKLVFWLTPFDGDLREKYLAGGIGTYTTTTPVPANIYDWKPVWTKK